MRILASVSLMLIWSGVAVLGDLHGGQTQRKSSGKSTTRKRESGRNDRAQQSRSKPNKDKKPKRMRGVTRAREAAAMAFVDEHAPELRALLLQLKRTLPRGFQRAVRDLFNTSERLARLEERGDREAYELQLRAWKIKSRIELLAAKLRRSDTPKCRRELRAALEEQIEVQLKIANHTRQSLQRRVDRVEEQIKRLEQERQQRVERRFKQWTRKNNNKKRSAKSRSAGAGVTSKKSQGK